MRILRLCLAATLQVAYVPGTGPLSSGNTEVMNHLRDYQMVGVHLDDVTSGFRVVSEPLLSRFADRYPAEYLGDTVESLLQAHASGATIVQVSVPMEQRSTGVATSRVAAGGHLARLAVAIVAGKPQGMGR